MKKRKTPFLCYLLNAIEIGNFIRYNMGID